MSRLPEKWELLDWIKENPDAAGKREISRAFGLKGSDRVELKRLMRELADEGEISPRRRRYEHPDLLPRVAILIITGPDEEGDLFARPEKWEGDGGVPRLLVRPRKSDPAFGAGDRVLLAPKDDDLLYCLDVASGKPIWTAPRRRVALSLRDEPD